VHERLRSPHAILLIDGLDEVPEEQFRDVETWVRGLVRAFPEARVVVTSREYRAEEGWMADEGFVTLNLEPMTRADIEQFVDHWHDAVGCGLPPGRGRDELPELSASLKGALRDNRPLRLLAANPLLCAVLCALHRERHRDLPQDRIPLYEACCEMLAERRDVERRLQGLDTSGVTYVQKRELLTYVAWYMAENGHMLLTPEQLDKCLSLRATWVLGAHTPGIQKALRDVLVQRSGLLREPVKGEVQFAHRTFQEYLTAQAAVDLGNMKLLAEHAHEERWREVAILAAGLGSASQATDLVTRLLRRGGRWRRHRHAALLVAFYCLETARSLDPAVRAQVTARVGDLIPPRNLREARALALAGDLAAPRLRYVPDWPPAHVEAAMHALGLIGTEAAATVLATFAELDRRPFDHALFEAALQFEQPALRTRVLVNAITLILSDIPVSDLTPLADLTGLQTLDLFRTQVSDLTPLAGLTGLQTLNLWDTRVSDLTPLAGLTGLQTLDLDQTQVSDLTPLAGLTGLQELYLSGTQISDLSPLAGLTGLQTLNLLGTRVSEEQVAELKRRLPRLRVASL
jgi:hypothetical protein